LLAANAGEVDGTASYEPPSNETERGLVAIWQEALGIEPIGVHDDFFALRGHSLLATRMIARICDAFSVELPLQCLFDKPTIAGVAESIEALRWAQTAPQPGDDDAGEREVLRL
jgi:acyl carrier protein